MRRVTLDLPDELADQLSALQDRLPELLALSLHQPTLPAGLYRRILTFLAGAPSAAEIAAFAPPPEAVTRLQTLLDRERAGSLTTHERAELEKLECIEHLMILLKAGAVPPRSLSRCREVRASCCILGR
ncbi:MAG TPA: hypothetical protein VFE42_31350 [Chloroflexota bacterium]|nr:hypothetical protein [Chloroflexota bacterium]